MGVGADTTTTARALEEIKLVVDIAYTEFELEIPVLAENECVTIGDTCTYSPTLIAVVGEILVRGTQEGDVVLQTSYIILTSEGVESDEVAREAVAEPVASLGLSHPMTPSCTLFYGPSIQVARDVECPSRSKAHLYTEVNGCGSVVEEVCLDGDILSFGCRCAKEQAK
jgi:hypothetical protein